jgi:hypothetical protein
MGYYYDWIDGKWAELDHTRKLTNKQRQIIDRRRELVGELVKEIAEGGESVIGLYARLLAGALVQSDEILMREMGKQIAGLSKDEATINQRRGA